MHIGIENFGVEGIMWTQLERIRGNKRISGRRSYAHLCAASGIRAMPEKEKPLAKLVDIYFCLLDTKEDRPK